MVQSTFCRPKQFSVAVAVAAHPSDLSLLFLSHIMVQDEESTTHLIKSASSLQYACFKERSLARGQKRGQPLATFISETGRWNDMDERSGRNVSITCSLWFWSIRKKVTWEDKEGCRYIRLWVVIKHFPVLLFDLK